MGLGGFEILVISAIALFVLGPKRLLEGIREGRKMYSDLKRQRDALQSMITEAIDLEDLKNEAEGIKKDVKALENDLKLDQVLDDAGAGGGEKGDKAGSSRAWKRSAPPIQVDPEVRNAIPDISLGGDDEIDASSTPAPVDDQQSDEVKS